jgi:hypothetical protein
VKKFLLMSILLSTIVFPVRAASEPNPRLGLKKALLYTVAYNVVYWVLLMTVYDRLS